MYLQQIFASIKSKLVFTNKIQTAGIYPNGEMLINQEFWDCLNAKEKDFIIDHECMHLFLKHHSRFSQSEITNVACDLAVNSLLMRYKYKIDDMPLIKKTAELPSIRGFPELQTAEWYLEALKSIHRDLQQPSFGQSICSAMQQLEKAVQEQTAGMRAGTEDPMSMEIFRQKSVKSQQKFGQFLAENIGSVHSEKYQFGFNERYGVPNRRSGHIHEDSLLPTDVYSENNLPIKKSSVLLFTDVSGSCIINKEWFFKAYASIPKNLFDVRLFIFDTSVREIKAGNQIQIGGGTRFDPIVDEVYQIEKTQKNPDLVFVFTDGQGSLNQLDKLRFDNWIWFLSSNGRTQTIPKKSKIHWLNQFVLN